MALENFAHLIWRESLSLVHFMALPLVLLFPFKLTLKRIHFLCRVTYIHTKFVKLMCY